MEAKAPYKKTMTMTSMQKTMTKFLIVARKKDYQNVKEY